MKPGDLPSRLFKGIRRAKLNIAQPEGDSHVFPARPTPRVWWPAITTVPSNDAPYDIRLKYNDHTRLNYALSNINTITISPWADTERYFGWLSSYQRQLCSIHTRIQRKPTVSYETKLYFYTNDVLPNKSIQLTHERARILQLLF